MTRTLLQRLRKVSLLVGALLTGAPLAFAAPTPGDASLGQAVYEAKCGGCHALDANRVGPLHRGVVGRKPGTAAGYAYSPAVKALGGVWTTRRLDQWLQGPQAMAPGARMFFSLPDPDQRRQVIAYLASVSPPQTVSPGPRHHRP